MEAGANGTRLKIRCADLATYLRALELLHDSRVANTSFGSKRLLISCQEADLPAPVRRHLEALNLKIETDLRYDLDL